MKQNAFCRLPKSLFTDGRYKKISSDAKILYSLLTDRLSLSEKNGWVDKNGATYLYFTHAEAMELLSIGKDKCVRVFSELSAAGLIERKKQGLGKPAMIYIKELGASEDTESAALKNRSQDSTKKRSVDAAKEEPNNININKNNNIKNNITTLSFGREEGLMREIVKENIDYNSLVTEYGSDTVDQITELMTEALMTKTGTVTINGTAMSRSAVSSRLLKLNHDHISYVIECLEGVANVKNIKGYMLSMLYNSFTTIDTYYRAAVNSDMQNYKTAENVAEYELKQTSDTGAPSRQKGSSNSVSSAESEDDEYARFINMSF